MNPDTKHAEVMAGIAHRRHLAASLAGKGQMTAALRVWDELMAQLESLAGDQSEREVAECMLNQAVAFGTLGCSERAFKNLADMRARFERNTDPAVVALLQQAREVAGDLQRFVATIRAGYPDMTSLAQLLSVPHQPAASHDDAAKPPPHFVNANVHGETFAAQISYAAHDRHRHQAGETGLVLIMGFADRVKSQLGKQPTALVTEAHRTVRESTAPDTNFALQVQAMAVYGLPPHLAAQHTHLGLCASRLDLPVRNVGVFAGSTLLLNFVRWSDPS